MVCVYSGARDDGDNHFARTLTHSLAFEPIVHLCRYAHDTKTGEVLWRYWAGGPCNGSPVVDYENGVVFFTARFDLLIALNASTGELLWKTRTNTLLASPTYYDGHILVGTQNSTVDAHNSTTGDRLWFVCSHGVAFAACARPWCMYGVARDHACGCIGGLQRLQRWQWCAHQRAFAAKLRSSYHGSDD